VISEQNPVRHGDVLLLYLTGGGVTSPSSVDGQIAVTSPFPLVAAKTTVTIGGLDCPVLYSGEASGLVAGAIQVNALIPANVPSGVQQVVVTFGDGSSQAGVTVVVE